MSVFQDYSKYYDLLYRDKDYEGEARYVHSLIQEHRPGAATLLELGCGTGGHAFPLARLGYRVRGVDCSAESLKRAQAKLAQRPDMADAVSFHQADIRALRLGERFDAVAALFHVMSYQTSQEDLRAALAGVREHLNPGGVFVFDFWHGPGVVCDPPKVAVKRCQDGESAVTRIAEPEVFAQRNVVDVHFTLFAEHKASGGITQMRETHCMRYFFEAELRGLLAEVGLQPLLHLRWMTGQAPDEACWNAVMVALRA